MDEKERQQRELLDKALSSLGFSRDFKKEVEARIFDSQESEESFEEEPVKRKPRRRGFC